MSVCRGLKPDYVVLDESASIDLEAAALALATKIDRKITAEMFGPSGPGHLTNSGVFMRTEATAAEVEREQSMPIFIGMDLAQPGAERGVEMPVRFQRRRHAMCVKCLTGRHLSCSSPACSCIHREPRRQWWRGW